MAFKERLFLLILVCLLAARAAEAQTYLWFEPQLSWPEVLVSESWATTLDGRIENYQKIVEKNDKLGEFFGNFSFGHQWKPWLGINFQTAHGNRWGETVIGPAFQLNDELNIGLAFGIEHYWPKQPRLRVSAYYDDSETASFIYGQVGIGKDSRWVWMDATHMFNRKIGMGVLIQMPDAGVGPKLELRAGEHFGIWVAPVYDWENKVVRGLIGSRIMWER